MRRRDDEKERSIKEAVIKLILEEGFHGTSISKIAKEAGVSPATVYIYFENKEVMLQDIYQEYAEEIFDYLVNEISCKMQGPQLIELLITNYYTYIRGHKEIFNFVEQFSNCPSLVRRCSADRGLCRIDALIQEMKQKQIIKNYNSSNLMAILFYPVKAIALDHCKTEEEREELLRELICIVQDALLIR